MRYTEDLARLRAEADEQLMRRIVREEIVHALGALAREAEHQDMPYETAELDSRVLDNVRKVAEGAVLRLTCEHPSYYTWHDQSRCSRCGEPEPAPPADPFADRPLDPGCHHAFATDEQGVTSCQICEGVKSRG